MTRYEFANAVEDALRGSNAQDRAYVMYDILSGAFHWGSTTEGDAYWRQVYDNLYRIAEYGLEGGTAKSSAVPQQQRQAAQTSFNTLFGPISRDKANVDRIHQITYATACAPGAYDDKPNYNPTEED